MESNRHHEERSPMQGIFTLGRLSQHKQWFAGLVLEQTLCVMAGQHTHDTAPGLPTEEDGGTEEH